jgi:2-hydroxychromene-2-carboxylate isomerase
MHTIDFWFDPISPYAALAFERLPEALEGLSVVVQYRPVLFAGLLKHWGQLGPAEIVPKRAWTYRHAAWLARSQGSALQMPALHPFNPLPLLRLCWAAATPADAALGQALPNRRVVEAIFDHVWKGGGDPSDPVRLAALSERLQPSRDPASDEVKQALRTSGEAAVAAGVFGVPSLVSGGRLFWGLDSLPMLRASLQGDPWFDSSDWTAADALPIGQARRQVS